MISDEDIRSRIEATDLSRILNFYRASELHGMAVIARLLRLSPSERRVDYHRHVADEARHAYMWAEVMTELGHDLEVPTDSYQIGIMRSFGLARSYEDLVALSLVTERRAAQVYMLHADLSPPRPVASTLEQIFADEAWHVRSLADELERVDPGDSVRTRAEEAELSALSSLAETGEFKSWFQ
ncbi:MAG: ferritin-like domain-containing protein [bacterium]|nr:ferritin-like domain-containing protein [bacterium]